ncbi:hypothetical protein ACOSP7_023736 [Xanthoceras sorbifolium]
MFGHIKASLLCYGGIILLQDGANTIIYSCAPCKVGVLSSNDNIRVFKLKEEMMTLIGEDTLYRILSKNGCAPEWVELNKDIRSQVSQWGVALKKAWAVKRNGDDQTKWAQSSEVLQNQLRDINNKMSGLKWEKEVALLEVRRVMRG